MPKHLCLSLLRFFGLQWLRLRGARADSSVLIHGFPSVRIKQGGSILIERGVTLNSAEWSNPLNDGCRVRLCAVGGGKIILRANSGISSARLISHSLIEVGEGSAIGAGSLLCDSDMHEVPLGSDKPIGILPIVIGRNVFIGAQCIILKGVTIGDGAVIGAGSVVTRDIPAGAVAAGNPAVVVKRQRTEDGGRRTEDGF